MSDSVLEQLQQRLRHLEDIQSIQALKARYLRACDQKQPNAMRECFVEHGAVIEADGFPAFTDREEWVETFSRLAIANPSIQDMHHGHNPQISFMGADSAKGLWDLEFCQVNVKERTIVNLSGQYSDEYERINGYWQIRSMRFARGSFVMRQVDAGGIERVIALGKPPAAGFIGIN
ncbi:nuclear transport factor 2 family protein [Comamonas testosteroni]|uniref:nuclear transport factor 2 family protein n=1 Tax=Comamonas testosteroni TaxID=285 RepID=UPI0015FB6442|nr:nuclear transport factor 2 family protein [Comamonas testosteroni]